MRCGHVLNAEPQASVHFLNRARHNGTYGLHQRPTCPRLWGGQAARVTGYRAAFEIRFSMPASVAAHDYRVAPPGNSRSPLEEGVEAEVGRSGSPDRFVIGARRPTTGVAKAAPEPAIGAVPVTTRQFVARTTAESSGYAGADEVDGQSASEAPDLRVSSQPVTPSPRHVHVTASRPFRCPRSTATRGCGRRSSHPKS